MISIPEAWQPLLGKEVEKGYFRDLMQFVESEYDNQTVYPERENIFRALELCSPEEVQVVILGQDPYHGPGQANGLAFSVNPGVPLPPSLRNIYKEYQSDTGKNPPPDGDLTPWAKQGVLLLNATLTVRHKEPGSHQKQGWETFTDAVIQSISEHCQHVVFILWGSYARKKQTLISTEHKIISSPHPSPLSAHRGFFGSKPFSQANSYLKSIKKPS